MVRRQGTLVVSVHFILVDLKLFPAGLFFMKGRFVILILYQKKMEAIG